jgi:hypothetical protein
MIMAIILDENQIQTVAEHLVNSTNMGAKSVVIYLASEESEVADLNRRYEEFQQGDPPINLPTPHTAYLGPTWVIGTANMPVDLFEKLDPGIDDFANGS